MNQWQDRVADDVRLVAHVIEIDALQARLLFDGLRGFGRDHPTTCFGFGQCHLDFDVTRDQALIGEHIAHGLRAKGVAKENWNQ